MKQRIEFAKWYRDKLNIEQKRKMKVVLDHGKSVHNPQAAYVTLEAVLAMINGMEIDFCYTYQKAKEKLKEYIY